MQRAKPAGGAKSSSAKTGGIKARLATASTRLSHAALLGLAAMIFVPPPIPQQPLSPVRDVAELPSQNSDPPDIATAGPTAEAAVAPSAPDTNTKTTTEAGERLQESNTPAEVRPAGVDVIVPPVKRMPPITPVISSTTVVLTEDELPISKRAMQQRSTDQENTAKPNHDDAPSTEKPQPKPEQMQVIGVATKKEKYTVIPHWSDEQISEARQACAKLLDGAGDITATDAPPVKEGACGAPAPIAVRSIGAPKIKFASAVTVTCPLAAALNKWVTDKLQPAAIEHFKSPVVKLLSASSYSCRNRYSRSETPLSEHALLNALDVAGFELADGRTIRVRNDWGATARDTPSFPALLAKNETGKNGKTKVGLSKLGKGAEALSINVKVKGVAAPAKQADQKKDVPIPQDKQDKKQANEKEPTVTLEARKAAFLRRIHDGACGIFGTVLGPEANDAHRDHFHFDMKARRRNAYCQ
jgi:hypothetical protein